MLLGVAVLIGLALFVRHRPQATATRGPIQRLYAPITIDPVDLAEKLRAGNLDAVQSAIKTAEAAANADPRAELNLTYAMSTPSSYCEGAAT
jgi:hypothetical protein